VGHFYLSAIPAGIHPDWFGYLIHSKIAAMIIPGDYSGISVKKPEPGHSRRWRRDEQNQLANKILALNSAEPTGVVLDIEAC
jgi:hypothetical protein